MKRTWPRPLRWVTVIVLVSGCAHGITTFASSPDAFSLAPGTKVTLHLRSGEDITGEYCDQNESSVALDSGSIRVLKTLGGSSSSPHARGPCTP